MQSAGNVSGTMDDVWRFWMTWGVSLAAVVATFCAVMVALFGEWIRAKLFVPRLTVTLVSGSGERIPVTLTPPNGSPRIEEGRHYRIRVSNEKRWPKATQVRVHLTRLEEPGPDGQLQLKWTGEVPLRWTHQEIMPLERTVGPDATCDFCSVVKDKWLQLHPLIMPNNLAEIAFRRVPAKVDMTVSLVARSSEADSPIKRLQIAWDGRWSAGEAEMAQHLVIKELI